MVPAVSDSKAQIRENPPTAMESAVLFCYKRAMFYVIWCCRDDLMAYHVDTNSALVRADLVW